MTLSNLLKENVALKQLVGTGYIMQMKAAASQTGKNYFRTIEISRN
jgi:hypothetical protein